MTEQDEQELTKEQEAEREHWQDLEDRLTDELEAILAEAAEPSNPHDPNAQALYEIQPTSFVVRLAAQAAAAVLMAFEHGYQMPGE